MALLQPRLSLKVAQRQILTPGLMQMVSVLALNKLELKEMINTEIIENPVLEELEESVPLLDEVASQEASQERPAEEIVADAQREKTDPFEEIDFGSYFQEYLDPGFRSPSNYEDNEKPSFENFLSQPSTLTDHLLWQLGSLPLSKEVRVAAEYIIGNIDETGYLTASDDELLEGYLDEQPEPVAAMAVAAKPVTSDRSSFSNGSAYIESAEPNGYHDSYVEPSRHEYAAHDRAILALALQTVRALDPIGVASRDLRECLLTQIRAHSLAIQIAAERLARHQAAIEEEDDEEEEDSPASAVTVESETEPEAPPAIAEPAPTATRPAYRDRRDRNRNHR